MIGLDLGELPAKNFDVEIRAYRRLARLAKKWNRDGKRRDDRDKPENQPSAHAFWSSPSSRSRSGRRREHWP